MIQDGIGRLRGHCGVENNTFFELLKENPSLINLGLVPVPQSHYTPSKDKSNDAVLDATGKDVLRYFVKSAF